MKKRPFLLFFFVLFILNVAGQTMPSSLKQVLDSTLYYSKQSTLYAKRVNWDSVETKVYQLAANAKTIKELQPALSFLLNSLDDPHGRYLNAADYSTIAHFTDWKRHQSKNPDKRIREDKAHAIVNDTALHFSYRLLNKNTGYLKIVGISPVADAEKEANAIRNAIREMAGKKASQWIIDLRYNGGGNMNPMMAGLAPLLGEGRSIYLTNLEKDTLSQWRVVKNNFFENDFKVIDMPAKPVFPKAPKVAVLLSRYTVSSGEFVAVNFKGRPQTRFFGETSGGLTTSTNWLNIGNELIICISAGIYCDRKGTVYQQGVPVDEEVVFTANAEPAKDKGIQAALRWLQKK
jgi:carboxyl-terminal processing protease